MAHTFGGVHGCTHSVYDRMGSSNCAARGPRADDVRVENDAMRSMLMFWSWILSLNARFEGYLVENYRLVSWRFYLMREGCLALQNCFL